MQYTILTIPRARKVHQSLATTPLTAIYSLLVCAYHITFAPVLASVLSRPPGPFPAEALILNGPGTCFVLTTAVYVNKVGSLAQKCSRTVVADGPLKFVGLPSPRIIYVETFARVRSLSVSAKLLRYLADRHVSLFNASWYPLMFRSIQICRAMAGEPTHWAKRRLPWLDGLRVFA